MEHFIARTKELDLSLTGRQIEQFALYQDLLLEWNERMNLTGAKTPYEIQVRHFADSLTCAIVTGDLSFQSLIDVGSGAGFPGLPLKILFPSMKLALLESVAKKGKFLQQVVKELGLEDVSVVVNRAETAGHDAAHRQQYDWAAARAVAHLSPVLEYLLPFCRLGGHALAQKGARAAAEIVEAQAAMGLLGGELVDQVPVRSAELTDAVLIVVKKVRDTLQKYPRRAGIPAKRPL